MSALLGTRWVHAIHRDVEARADWEKWLQEFRMWHLEKLVDAKNTVEVHQLQGQVQAIDEIVSFMESTLEVYRHDEERTRQN